MFLRTLLLLTAIHGGAALRMNLFKADPSQQILDDLLISKCTMDVDLKAKTIQVKYPGGEMTLSEKGMNGNDDTDSIIPEGKGLVCEITNTQPKKGAMGIFTQATSTKYIFHNDEEEVWPGFANKLCYARQHGYRFFMWFGNLPNATLESLKDSREEDALPCQDTKKLTIHYLRSIGMAAVMRENPDMPWLVQMDIQDQIIAPFHFDKAFETNFLTSGTDIVAAAPHYGVFLNAGAIAFKNSQWSRDFMMTWFKNRCGGKDQLSLWNSLFNEWTKEGHDFHFDSKKMENYKEGLPHALEAAGNFGEGGKPLQSYNRTHILEKSVNLPHLTILPNGGEGCANTLCMRFSDSGEMPFFWSGSTCKHVWGKGDEDCNPMNQVCKTSEHCQCW